MEYVELLRDDRFLSVGAVTPDPAYVGMLQGRPVYLLDAHAAKRAGGMGRAASNKTAIRQAAASSSSVLPNGGN